MNNRLNSFNYVLNKPAFYALLCSGAFIILLWSPKVLGGHVSPLITTIIFIFPWLMVCLVYSWQTITDRSHRVEIVCIIAIIILGVINTALSDSFSKSIFEMRTFLLTGILAFWAAMFLITDQHRRQVFDWFCCACLAIIVAVELTSWVLHVSNFDIFSRNPIPLGTLVILLSSGLLALLLSPHLRVKIGGWLLTSLGLILLRYAGKRGSFLAVAAMFLGWMLFKSRRLRYLAAIALLTIGFVAVFQGPRLVARLNPAIPHQFTILYRLEMYPFALHVWQIHPIMGIGLRSFTHQRYLANYQQHYPNLQGFSENAAHMQTFDNMLLTGFVELGTVMMLFYLGLVIFIIIRYYRTLCISPGSTTLDWFRLLIILGFAVHSLTYDSLLFPPVNWLFHVQLGLMAAYPTAAAALDSVTG